MSKIIKLKDLLVEQPPTQKPPAPKPPASSGGGEGEPKKLKIDIPDSPFEPDVNQVKDRLKQILKQWKIKEYPSDESRWKQYYNDIFKLVRQLEGDK